jgi:prepilin peptidase CpaA
MLQSLYSFFGNPQSYAIWLSILLALVILWDMRAYVIPNWINMAIFLSFAPAAYFMDLNAMQAGVAMAFMLGLTMVLFSLGVIGGGDAKLLTVLTLWSGYDNASLVFIVYTALLGGVLVIFLWVARRLIHIVWRKNLPPLLSRGAPIPYGVAIAGAFLLMLWQNRIPSLPL